MNAPITKENSFRSRLVDRQGRVITYLRLSITDRCNLRCRYCMPEEGVEFLGHDKILSYEELERLSRVFVGLGVEKIRITGGEPFVRKGCMEFLERVRMTNPEVKLHVTTNGVAVLPHLPGLKNIGIGGLNLSLDTLDAAKFAEITRRDRLETVLAVFHESMRLGIPLKVNSVVQPETTDEDLLEMSRLVKDNAVALRFIEFMPFSGKKHIEHKVDATLEERLFRLFPGLTEISSNLVETARKFSVEGYQGTLGIIEGESRKFCSECNKLRITSAGILKNCLYDKGVLDLRTFMRSGVTDDELEAAIRSSVEKKLDDGYASAKKQEQNQEESMATIGG